MLVTTDRAIENLAIARRSAEGRAYRWLTSSLPARSKFTPLFQVVAFKAIYRKRDDAVFCQRCLRIIQCSVTWKRKLLRPYLYELIKLSAQPLKSIEEDFAIDSSGFSTGQFMRWLDVKYGKEEDRRMWIKVHLMCGVKTNVVTSVEISDGYSNDHGYFKPLLEAAAANGFTLKEVSADKAYLSGENLLTTLRHKAIPYIPFKSNSKAQTNYGPKSTLWTRMLEFYTDHREEFLTHYHKRSNVETTFHMIKSKFGQRLRSKTLTAQINEALCKVLCHNLCVVIQSVHELGIEANFGQEPVKYV